MSAFGAGTMRASWEATRLLLVLLLTTSTGTVFSESGNGQVDSQTDLPHMETERQELTPDDVVSAKAQTIPESISTSDKSPTEGILNTQKEDVFLEESSSEKVPMPMFEEDVPSVLELEMDELDGWIKKDGEITLEVKET
ncbi:transmembrane protein 154 isoform X6 [Thalassophryne amazonica]|uniref:transmembrane protein 154 isoform X6 n=1 Tax=Thalassophryne amazonica TaxID=390379 RepID=UPI001471316A|nr:transmembrane protein 154 isoform X6 [Thalassophryne amazonica]